MNNTLSPVDNDEPLSVWAKLRVLVGGKADSSLRETIEEYIDEEPEDADEGSSAQHERVLLSNILDLRDLTVDKVMVQRADILALSVEADQAEVLKFFGDVHVSRVPVYQESLDHILGTVHIKDVLTVLADGKEVVLKDLVTDVPVVSPNMPLLDMLLEMRQNARHMAVVVDEYGGVDGLVTVGDVIEEIVGEIEDEHDRDDDPEMIDEEEGSILVDARVELEDFCERYEIAFQEDDLGEAETIGGLVFMIAGRVPSRGELLKHKSGLNFEIIDADPRRVHRIRIRGLGHDKKRTRT